MANPTISGFNSRCNNLCAGRCACSSIGPRTSRACPLCRSATGTVRPRLPCRRAPPLCEDNEDRCRLLPRGARRAPRPQGALRYGALLRDRNLSPCDGAPPLPTLPCRTVALCAEPSRHRVLRGPRAPRTPTRAGLRLPALRPFAPPGVFSARGPATQLTSSLTRPRTAPARRRGRGRCLRFQLMLAAVQLMLIWLQFLNIDLVLI